MLGAGVVSDFSVQAECGGKRFRFSDGAYEILPLLQPKLVATLAIIVTYSLLGEYKFFLCAKKIDNFERRQIVRKMFIYAI